MSLKQLFEPLKPSSIQFLIGADLSYFLSIWLVYINLAWLVYALTKSSFDLSLLSIAFYAPFFFILPMAGVIADHFKRRTILMICQICLLVPVLLFAWFSYHHALTFPLILLLTVLYACCCAIAYPASLAYIKDLVHNKNDTFRVVGFINATTRTSQFISGALNGLIHLLWSYTAAFISAFVCNLIALFCYFKTKEIIPDATTPMCQPWRDLKDGFLYIYTFSPFWSIALLVATTNIFGGAYIIQLPAFVANYLGGNINFLSYLYAASGIGGITGGIFVSIRLKSKHLMRMTAITTVVTGILLGVFSFSQHLVSSLILAFMIDAGYVIVLIGGTGTLLTLAVDEMRGRAMGMFGMLFLGLYPVGQLIVGTIASFTSIRIALLIVGIIFIIVGIWYLLNLCKFRQLLKPIYQQMNMPVDNQPI